MTNLRLATVCVTWIQGTIACGSSTSDAITGGAMGAGGSGDASTSGGAANTGGGRTGGASNSSGGAVSNGGANTGGGGANTGNGGANGGGGGAATGNGGAVGSGGANATGGATGNGGAATGGAPSTGGASGDAGVACPFLHPIVNGSARTCNSGFCYCSGKDSCYTDQTASSCCKEPVVCGAGAQNPVATINHPGDGENRAPNTDIPFIGVATDPQDGTLSGASLVWTSSLLSTPIGTGTSFNAPLPAGTHIITLTATDSNSNTGTDTITLNVQ